MTTWGISDFVDQTTGVSDGKFSISLSFPNQEYATKNSTMFLDKVKAFETAILNEAVKNSELWWGEKLTLDILKYSFFPILKFPKIKGTKKPDMTKSPTLSAKVPFYEKDNRWNVELYDTNGSLIFPCENEEMTPAHFVPKLSNVACVLQCGGIWIGGKGWVDDSDEEDETEKPAAKLVTQVVVEEKPVVVDTPVVAAATAPEKKVIKKVVKKAA